MVICICLSISRIIVACNWMYIKHNHEWTDFCTKYFICKTKTLWAILIHQMHHLRLLRRVNNSHNNAKQISHFMANICGEKGSFCFKIMVNYCGYVFNFDTVFAFWRKTHINRNSSWSCHAIIQSEKRNLHV